MIYACGFNAFGQLRNDTNDDICTPQKIHDTADDVFFAGWSETILKVDNTLIRAGIECDDWTQIEILLDSDQKFDHGIGDHNGLIGALNSSFRFCQITTPNRLALLSTPDRPKIARIACAGNGKVAIVLGQPETGLAQIFEFPTFIDFKHWVVDSTTGSLGRIYRGNKSHAIEGRIKQLTASATTFVLLLDSGEVYTWGDARHRNLGRNTSTVDETLASADEPGMVEALGGVKIAKVAAGCWMTIVLSEDGAAYIWGRGTPGTEHTLRALADLDPSEVALIDILDSINGEPMDVLDIAVGDGHALLLMQDGHVYGAGENSNGQVGIDSKYQYVDDWRRLDVEAELTCLGVHAGSKSSFMKLRNNSDDPL